MCVDYLQVHKRHKYSYHNLKMDLDSSSSDEEIQWQRLAVDFLNLNNNSKTSLFDNNKQNLIRQISSDQRSGGHCKVVDHEKEKTTASNKASSDNCDCGRTNVNVNLTFNCVTLPCTSPTERTSGEPTKSKIPYTHVLCTSGHKPNLNICACSPLCVQGASNSTHCKTCVCSIPSPLPSFISTASNPFFPPSPSPPPVPPRTDRNLKPPRSKSPGINSDEKSSNLQYQDDSVIIGNCKAELEQCGYYYEKTTWQEARTKLKDTQVGTFLIRDSSDPKFLFSLSVQTDKGPTSVRIHYSGGYFRLDSEKPSNGLLPRFTSVSKLVDYYIQLSKDGGSKANMFLDKQGSVFSSITITKPLYSHLPTLKHICRVMINRHCSNVDATDLPKLLKEYVKQYPHCH